MKHCIFLSALFLLIPRFTSAEKLILAHVAINPSQGIFWVAKDSGILAKYGFTADIVLIPGTPRTVQALIAGDLDYAVAGSPAALRARMQGADVVMLAGLSSYPSQRVFVKKDSAIQSLTELKGKIVGVTQFGSAGDTFFRSALKKVGLKDSDVTVLQLGGTPGVSQALEAGRIEVGVLGESGMLLVFRGIARPLKGASARELGFKGVDGPLSTTERKIKADRGAVLRLVQAYVEAIHHFRTNKAGTFRIFKKHIRGLNDEDLGMWLEDVRESLRPLPTPAERATEPPTDHAQGQGETPRTSWARLLKRVFDIDIEHCPNCGGSLKIIAAIEDPPVIIKILSHLGLPTRAPPRAPARRVDLFQTI